MPIRLLLLLSCIVTVTACGQKGDLYLPDQTPPPATESQP
ncbi:LPS translocon maturation chaperone LptM [Bacterioplanes sanyensis]|nr:lipoprotein [Bacterioplanes sanyensis]